MILYATILLYSITMSLFFPFFQSLVFFKSCVVLLQESHDSSYTQCYDNSRSAKDDKVHALANFVLLISSAGLCVTAFFTSRFIGKFSDRRSRKWAFIIPFFGLLLCDIAVLVQIVFVELSPYWFIASEIVFGMFGGYMSITSGAFAIVSSRHRKSDERSKAIARLEATVAFGGMIGYLISSQLKHFDYIGMSIFLFLLHSLAFLTAMFLQEPANITENSTIVSLWDSSQVFSGKPRRAIRGLWILYFSFACSYFAFIGSTRVLFFYLKHKFYWANERYGYLRALNQAMTTLMSVVLYPFLKSRNIGDVTLAIFGLFTRSFARFWYAIAWNDLTIFSVVLFEMFSKFPATAMRSLISTNVKFDERGSAFALVAVVEAVCNLSSSFVFHTLFPASLKTYPEISFIIMPLIVFPAIVLLSWYRETIENGYIPMDREEQQRLSNDSSSK